MSITRRERKIIRMKGYDYSNPGLYFATVVTQNRLSLFGSRSGETIEMNAAGKMVAAWWEKLPVKFPGVTLDEYVVMPDHFHAILCLEETNAKGISLSTVIQWWKTMTSNDYIHGVNHEGWPPFDQRLWQRSFYDRIIRSEVELHQIREYIKFNPISWTDDNCDWISE